MPKDIVVPPLGLTAEEVTVERWLKNEGSEVVRGEPVVEVLTDKATIEIEAGESGVLAKIAVGVEETVPVGAVIGVISLPGEDPSDVASEEDGAAAAAAPVRSAEASAGTARRAVARVRATPVVRRLAADNGIDIGEIEGTGTDGRIERGDVEAAIAVGSAAQSTEAAPSEAATRRRGSQRRLSDEQIRLAKHLAEAAAVPQFNVSRLVDIGPLTDHRRRTRASLTATDYFIKAAAVALLRYPTLNASLVERELIFPPGVNIGIAVAAGEDLRVPVMRDVQEKTLEEIADARHKLVERARTGALTRAETVDGTFTISNLGMYGVDDFTPLLSPPQAAIMGVAQAVSINGRLLARVRLVCDHRVVNGATACLFLEALNGLLAWPAAVDSRTSEG